MPNSKQNVQIAKKKTSVDSIVEQNKDYMIAGDFYAAATGFKLALRQPMPDEERNNLIFFLGLILNVLGNKAEAEKCFDKIIEANSNPQAYIYKAGIQLELGKYAAAWETLKKAPRDKFSSELFKKYTSIIALEINKPDIAMKLLSENKRLTEDLYMRQLYILSLMRTGRHEDAQKETVDLLQNSKDKTNAMMLLEWISIFTEQEQEVFGLIGKMLKTTETPCEVDFASGAMAYLTNSSAKAQDLIRSAVGKLRMTGRLTEHLAMQIMASALRVMAVEREDIAADLVNMQKENLLLKKKSDDMDIKTEAILNMLSQKNCFLGEKCRKIGDTAGFLAHFNKDLGEQEIKDIKTAGYLCNLGMLFIPDEVFTKKTPLTQGEKKLMKEHSILSVTLARPFGYSNKILEIIKRHHEKVDGTGFPGNLKEEQIPYGAKLVGIAEFFVECTAGSPRQEPISIQDTIKTAQRLAGLHFSREMCLLLKEAYILS